MRGEISTFFFIFLVTLFVASLTGCTSTRTSWQSERLPVTQEEVAMVENHVRQTLCVTRGDLVLSGSDQDMDDYASTVYRNACQNLCKPRMFEYVHPGGFLGGEYPTKTGRWKEMEEVKQ